jgi:hypothetical protein
MECFGGSAEEGSSSARRASPWGRRGSCSGGSGLSPTPVALRCGVDLVGRRPVWSAASGLACGVLL